MLDLKLRDEFRGKKLKGTTIDFTNQSKTGALEVSAAEFLKITYPSHDLLKTIEATGPNQSRPVVLLGGRGQGKSHLLAALYHLCTNPEAGRQWLTEWAGNLGNQLLGNLKLRSESCVIAESLHLNRFTFLWDVLFNRHPHGAYCRGMWESVGPEKKTEVPSDLILIEMFRKQPTVLILDEFQTWFDGQTNTKQYPRKKWAFNFIQVLSEIAQTNPELLVLVVSVRENESEAYQQIHRVNPALVDFKGPQAKRDRQRLLLYRIFENRMQVPSSKIATLVQPHISEYFRLAKVPQPEQERRHDDFIEAWPFSPLLLKLLDDQVLIATSAQETRDLIKILVDLFKNTDPKNPIITAADFRLSSESSVVASLLDSVSNQLHKDLREKAQRNLQAVMDAVNNAKTVLPHCEEIISALWLRSLTVDRLVGADPAELQIDITRAKPIDDNQFAGELASIEENSFNIHRIGIRLVFKNEENPQAKLLAHAKNDKLFQHDEDIDHLAKEIRACISGPEHVSQLYRVVVLKKKWQSNPWSEFDEKEHPKNWDARLPMAVMPESPEKIEAAIGNWLKTHLQEGRNTIRFLLPQRGTGNVYYDRELLILARAIYLAMQWSETDPVYRPLKTKFQNELTGKLKNRFDRFAVLDIWNFGEPAKCKFEERSHGAQGDKIPETVDKIIKQDVFIPEEFETFVLKLAEGTESVGKLLKDLREPRPSGNPCIPWLGEVEVKERVIKMCAAGQIAINVRGHDLLQARPGETYDDAWNRMKGKLGTGKHLDETPMYMPDAVVDSGGKPPTIVVPGNTPFFPGPVTNPGVTVPATITGNDVGPTNLFDGQGVTNTTKIPCSAPPTSGLNLLGQIEGWQIGPASQVTNVSLRTSKLTKGQLDALLKLFGDGVSSVSVNLQAMTGSQLQQLLKHLPDGVTYGLDLEKEAT